LQKLMKLKLAIHTCDNCWIHRVVQQFRDVFIRVIDLERESDGSIHHLFEVLAPNKIDEVSSSLMRDKTLEGVRLASLGEDRVLGWAKARCAHNCALAQPSSCFLTSVTSGNNGEVYWNFIGTSLSCRRFMQRLTEQGVLYRVEELRILKDKNVLTARQEIAVRTALTLGYFDYPKKINIRELAKILHISHGTLNEEIRKGVRKILSMYFEEQEMLGGKSRTKEAFTRHSLSLAISRGP